MSKFLNGLANSLKVPPSERTYNYSAKVFRPFVSRLLLRSRGQATIPNGLSPIKPDTLLSVIVAIILSLRICTRSVLPPDRGFQYFKGRTKFPLPRRVSIPATFSLYYMELLRGLLLRLSKRPRGIIMGGDIWCSRAELNCIWALLRVR